MTKCVGVTLNLKRLMPGYYRAEHEGHSVTIYQTRARGPEGGKIKGWNLQVDGVTVSDWLPSKKAAESTFWQGLTCGS